MGEANFSTEKRTKQPEQVQVNRKAMDLLQKFSEGLLAIRDEKQLFRFCVICASEFLSLDFSTLLLWVPQKHTLLIKDTIGFPENIIDTYYLEQGQGLAWYAFKRGKVAVVPDFLKEKRFKIPDLVFEKGIRSAIAAPMLRESEVAGILIGHSLEKRQFSPTEKRLFQAMANQPAVAIHCQIHQQKRKETEERYRKIFNTIQEVVFIIDPDSGRILESNKAASELFGMSTRELNQKGVKIISRDRECYTAQRLLAVMRKVKRRGPRTIRWKFTKSDGTSFWAEISLSKAVIGEKERIIAVVRDLTHRLQTEREIARRAAEFEAIFNAIQDIVVFADKDRKILKINPAAEKITGFTIDDVKGIPTKDMYVDPADHDQAGKAFFSPDGPVSLRPFKTRLKKKDGSEFHAEILGGPVRSGKGEILGYLGVIRDVSERLAFERQMQHVQKLESLGLLAGGIAHDFNNILMAIMGNADLAMDRLPKNSQAAKNISAIISASRKASNLCRQMLAYSGRGRFQMKTVDLNRLVRETHEMLKISISKKAPLILDLSKVPVPVKIDQTQLQQVIMNLVINASESLEDVSGRITIRTGQIRLGQNDLKSFIGSEGLPTGPYCFLEVSDTGCGMDEKTITRVFDPFFTTKFTGRGLGMAAVLGIIRGHLGAVKIQSTPGMGTTVTIILPAEKSCGISRAEDHQSCDSSDVMQGVILLVDDEEQIRQVAASMLEFLGFSVITASNGKEAIHKFETNRERISAILMDLTMPEMDGIEASRRILKTDGLAKIILSSGYDGDEVSRARQSLNISGFIQKPYRLSRLKKVLENTLKKNPSGEQ